MSPEHILARELQAIVRRSVQPSLSLSLSILFLHVQSGNSFYLKMYLTKPVVNYVPYLACSLGASTGKRSSREPEVVILAAPHAQTVLCGGRVEESSQAWALLPVDSTVLPSLMLFSGLVFIVSC